MRGKESGEGLGVCQEVKGEGGRGKKKWQNWNARGVRDFRDLFSVF